MSNTALSEPSPSTSIINQAKITQAYTQASLVVALFIWSFIAQNDCSLYQVGIKPDGTSPLVFPVTVWANSMCSCWCVCMWVFHCLYKKQGSLECCSLGTFWPLVGTRSLIGLEFHQASCLTSFQGSAGHHLPSHSTVTVCPVPPMCMAFYMRSGDPNSGPHAWESSFLPTEPCASALVVMFSLHRDFTSKFRAL